MEHPLCNTSRYEISLLESVLEQRNLDIFDVKTFSEVLSVIEKDGYDMSDFFLYNSTEEGSYTFTSMDDRRMFDISHYGGNDIEIQYLDGNYNQQSCGTIQEAVTKYHSV